jgi:23S rRNA (adenine2503-C2)-methyltransferase
MLHLLEQSPAELQAWFAAAALPAYRAAQVRRWIFEKRAASFDQMTDLPKAVRQQLAGALQIWTTRVAAHRQAEDGTEKLLLELADGQRIECVLLRDDRGHCAVCISTQVGCAMHCAFCASGLEGVVRNLTTGEILEQMLQLQLLLAPDGRLSHVVVMGMGEPLANLDRLLPALAQAADGDGLGIGARRITISTVGLPEGIRRLARDNVQYHLAVSLHAPNDALRNQLAPANRKVGIAAVMAAADEYFELTGRRVTFEYVLLAGVNDQPEHARQLLALLKGRPALVNIIPYNPVAGLPFRRPSARAAARFAEILTRGGLSVHLRRRKGERIDAACGQLRRSQS